MVVIDFFGILWYNERSTLIYCFEGVIDMKQRTGIIVATEKEQLQFFQVFGMPGRVHKSDSYDVASWEKYADKVYLIRSGYGEIAAASATQYLIDKYHVDRIINYGVVGSLSEKHQVKKVGIVRKIVHYGFDLSANGKYPIGRYPREDDLFLKPKKYALPSEYFGILNEFVCASSDRFVDGGKAKRQLQKDFGADICEMEAAGIVITCNKNNVPCAFIKAVSDGVDEGEQAFNDNVAEASKSCVLLLAKILQI